MPIIRQPDYTIRELLIKVSNETLSVAMCVIRVYDNAGNVIETHEHKGDFKE
jgi:hypothetical protein